MKTSAHPANPPQPSDEDLFGRFRTSGDIRAFEALVHRYEHELFGYLRRYLHSAELAEDVFQATFLRLHLSRDGFEEGRKFRPWLYSIATNQAIDILRRERRHQRAVHDGVGTAGQQCSLLGTVAARGQAPDENAGDHEERLQMRAAVRQLSDVQRRAVELVYERGLAYREAAIAMGVPVGTVKSRLHSALLSLGRIWPGRQLKRAYAVGPGA